MSVRVTMNSKISISPYRQLCQHSSAGTVKGNHSVFAHSPQPSAIYICGSEQAGYRSQPTASHKMKNIQSILLIATVALLFLVGKYAASYTGLASTL